MSFIGTFKSLNAPDLVGHFTFTEEGYCTFKALGPETPEEIRELSGRMILAGELILFELNGCRPHTIAGKFLPR